MTVSRMNIALAVIVLLVFAISASVNVDYTQPNFEFLPEMKYSPAYGAFAANENFGGGPTMQIPVAGTIARGEMPLHYEATKEDALRAGEELQNPYDPDSDQEELRQLAAGSVQRGTELYRVFCGCCHGMSGTGDGPIAQGRFAPIRSLIAEQSLQMPDGQMFHVLTYGQGSMAPFAAQLTPDQRWDVINYVRDLQMTADTPPPTPETEQSAP